MPSGNLMIDSRSGASSMVSVLVVPYACPVIADLGHLGSPVGPTLQFGNVIG